MLFVFRMRME